VLEKSIKQIHTVSIWVSLGLVLGLVLDLVLGLVPSRFSSVKYRQIFFTISLSIKKLLGSSMVSWRHDLFLNLAILS